MSHIPRFFRNTPARTWLPPFAKQLFAKGLGWYTLSGRGDLGGNTRTTALPTRASLGSDKVVCGCAGTAYGSGSALDRAKCCYATDKASTELGGSTNPRVSIFG